MDASAQKADTSNLPLPVDTVFVQAIRYDSATYRQFKKEKLYDYYHVKPKGESLLDRIRYYIYKYLLAPLSESRTANWIIVAGVVVALLLILYFFKPAWFYVNKKNKIAFDVENENINELDFDYLIKDALKSEQYAAAIRWDYLQLLKIMHLKELISWDAHKTVIEYVYELKQPALKPVFKEASQQFLCYRYGNFEASQENWDSFTTLTNNIVKQI